MMFRLANKDFQENFLTDILELKSTDLSIVTKDGVHRSHKLLLSIAFPALSTCILESNACCEDVTIFLPEESVDKVEEGLCKMIFDGDCSYLENILGINSCRRSSQKGKDISTKKKSVV